MQRYTVNLLCIQLLLKQRTYFFIQLQLKQRSPHLHVSCQLRVKDLLKVPTE